MNRIDELTSAFKARFDRFTIGCDSLEEVSVWDKDVNGELDVFCLNEIVSVVLRLITADDKIGAREVKYLNENFGFFYTVDNLKNVYENCKDEIDASFEKRISGDVDLLRSVNEKLADEFGALIKMIHGIIAESDGSVSPEEQDELDRIENAIDQA